MNKHTIAFLGWANISKGSLQGGGYNLVASEHAKYLADNGARVISLQSGTSYTFRLEKQKIRRKELWNGIECYSFINSHNRAPGLFNLLNKQYQIDDPQQNKIVCDWLKSYDVCKVFIHSLEGQALSLISDIKRYTGAEVYIICHDHFYICPQVKLLRKQRLVCLDYESGSRCESCINTDVDKKYELRQALRRLWALRTLNKLINKKNNPEIRKRLKIKPMPLEINKLFLNKLTTNEDGGFYAKRRRAAIEYLKTADNVFSPSKFITQYLQKCGLNEKDVRYFKLGLPHLDALKTVNSSRIADGKIIFCCLGSDLYLKGVRFFLEAVRMMNPDIRKRGRFIVKGIINISSFNEYLNEIAELEISGEYHVDEISELSGSYDVGVLPHLWFENSPITMLEHMALGKPVIAAAIGGVVEYIEDKNNGWLFQAGNIQALADLMEEVTSGEIYTDGTPADSVGSFENCMNILNGYQ